MGHQRHEYPCFAVCTTIPVMRHLLVCLISLALLVGCQRSEPASDAPYEGTVEPSEDQPSQDLEKSAPAEPGVGTPEPSAEVAPGSAAQAGDPQERDEGGEEESAEPHDEAATRDLSAELHDAVGEPRECIQDFERATPTTLQITVTALVRPSGAVIQPSVSGAGLSQDARQCIARRVSSVVLKPLRDDASQRVSTVIAIDYVPPSVVGAKAGAPDPELRNVREPLPKRPEVAPSGRPIQEPTSRPIQEPTSRPIQEPSSRKVRGPQPRPIDGWETDESSKEWR